MLTEHAAVRGEEQDRAIERPAFALDHADDQMNRAIGGDHAEAPDRRPRHLHSAVVVAPEIFAAGRRAYAHHRAEIEPFRIGRNESLGKHDELRPAGARLSYQMLDLIERCLPIEDDRRALYHSSFYDGHDNPLLRYRPYRRRSV